jgi:hypothetical protein
MITLIAQSDLFPPFPASSRQLPRPMVMGWKLSISMLDHLIRGHTGPISIGKGCLQRFVVVSKSGFGYPKGLPIRWCDCQLPIASSPITGYQLPIANYQLPIATWYWYGVKHATLSIFMPVTALY